MTLRNETDSVSVGSRLRSREGYIYTVESNRAGWVLARAEAHPSWTYSGDALLDFRSPKWTRVAALPGEQP